MSKEELIKFLKENLRVELVDDSDFYDDRISVKVYLGYDLISEDSMRISK